MRQSVEIANICVHQIFGIDRLTPHFCVEVKASGREPAGPSVASATRRKVPASVRELIQRSAVVGGTALAIYWLETATRVRAFRAASRSSITSTMDRSKKIRTKNSIALSPKSDYGANVFGANQFGMIRRGGRRWCRSVGDEAVRDGL